MEKEIEFPWPKMPRLSQADERRLVRLIQAGLQSPDDPKIVAASVRAVNDLVMANLGLVREYARRYYRRHEEKIPIEDLIQEGLIGLTKAAWRFDPEKGRFSTYVTYWIKQALRRVAEENSLIHIPINKREVRKNSYELSPPLNLEEVFPDFEEGEPRDWAEVIADPTADRPDREAERSDLRRLLEKHLTALTDQERIVIIHRYGFDDGVVRTLADIGRPLGLSRERVRQIEKIALEKLRQRLEGEIDI